MSLTQQADSYLRLLLEDLFDMTQKTTNQNQEWGFHMSPEMMKVINASMIPILREQKASKGYMPSVGNISTEQAIEFLTTLESGKSVRMTVNRFQLYRIKLRNARQNYYKDHPKAGGTKARKTRRRPTARSTRRRR